MGAPEGITLSSVTAERPTFIAATLAHRGESNDAFQWLERAVESKDWSVGEIVADPFFTNLKSDPRWLPFLERIGRSPDQLEAIELKVTLPGR